MKRFWIIILAGVVIELTRGFFPPELQALPQSPAGWTRVTETALDPIPHEWPQTSQARKAWRGTYTGTAEVTLTLYAMPWSPGNSWDAIQRWRPVPGAMAFAKGRYFGIAASQSADQAELKRFIEGVAATLPNGAVSIR